MKRNKKELDVQTEETKQVVHTNRRRKQYITTGCDGMKGKKTECHNINEEK